MDFKVGDKIKFNGNAANILSIRRENDEYNLFIEEIHSGEKFWIKEEYLKQNKLENGASTLTDLESKNIPEEFCILYGKCDKLYQAWHERDQVRLLLGMSEIVSCLKRISEKLGINVDNGVQTHGTS